MPQWRPNAAKKSGEGSNILEYEHQSVFSKIWRSFTKFKFHKSILLHIEKMNETENFCSHRAYLCHWLDRETKQIDKINKMSSDCDVL